VSEDDIIYVTSWFSIIMVEDKIQQDMFIKAKGKDKWLRKQNGLNN